MEGFARHDPVLNVLVLRMTNLRGETSTKRPVRESVFHTCKTEILRRPLHLLFDAEKGASLTQPRSPQLYRRILRPFYELVAPATVGELCMIAAISDYSQANVPPPWRGCVLFLDRHIVVYLQDYQALDDARRTGYG